MTIDVRARRAATDLHAAVRQTRPAPRRRSTRLSFAVLLAVLIAAAAVGARMGSSDHPTEVPTADIDLPRFVPDWLPDGVVLRDVVEQPAPPDDTTQQAWFVGPTGTVVSMVYERSTGSFGDRVDLGAAAGARVTLVRGGRVATAIVWTNRSSTNVLWSYTDSEAALRMMAAELAAASPSPENTFERAGYEVFDLVDGSWLGGGRGPSRTLRYEDDRNRSSVTLHITTGAGEHPIAEEYLNVSVAAVRGHRAWRPPDVLLDVPTIAWLEQPGVQVSVQASDGLDTARQVAESLRPVDVDEWDAVKAGARPAGPRSLTIDDYDVLFEGRDSTGMRWGLARSKRPPVGRLTLIVDRDGNDFRGSISSSSVSGSLRIYADRGQGTSGQQNVQVVYGMAEATVARVVVETTGPTYDAQLGEPNNGTRPFAVAVEPFSTERVRTFDAAGNELGDITVVRR